MIYGDTDSVMIHIPYLTDGNIREANRVSELITEKCNSSLYPEGVVLEFEKIYKPYLIVRKKKYIGLLWLYTKVRDTKTGEIFNLPDPLYIDAKGVMSVRRDNALVESELMKKIQSVLMGLTSEDKVIVPGVETVPPHWKPEEKPRPVYLKKPQPPDPLLAKSIIKETLSSISLGEIPLDKFTITKSLSRREEDYTNLQPHVHVNRRIRKRNPGTEYPLGARIPYIVADVKERTSTLKARDPLWMIQKGRLPDFRYYRDRLSKPLVQIMAPVLYPHEFKSACERSEFIESLFGNDEDDKNDSDVEMEDFTELDLLAPEVYMEDDEEEDLAQKFNELNVPHLSNSKTWKKDKKCSISSIQDFLEFNKVYNSTEDNVVRKTYRDLFLGATSKRSKTVNASRRKYEHEKKKNSETKDIPSIYNIVEISDSQRNILENEDKEKEAFISYRNYRDVVNTIEETDRKKYDIYVAESSEKETNIFERGKDTLKKILDPKEGCARMIQYDWGNRLEKLNKERNFRSTHPDLYNKFKEKYFTNTEVSVVSSSSQKKRKYKKSRDKYKKLGEDITMDNLVIKKKRRPNSIV